MAESMRVDDNNNGTTAAVDEFGVLLLVAVVELYNNSVDVMGWLFFGVDVDANGIDDAEFNPNGGEE